MAHDGDSSGFSFDDADGINNAGQIVGSVYMQSKNYHAFITGPNGVGIADMETLKGLNHSWGNAVNDFGKMVGQSCNVILLNGTDKT